MKQTIWIKHERSDRNIILITNKGMLEGVNYWKGLDDCDELFDDYNRTDERLTTYVLPQLFKKYDTHCILPHREYDDIIETIDDIIWNYVDRDNETIALFSIGQWLFGSRMYTMHKSENGLILPCAYSQEDETDLDMITTWPFDDVSKAEIARVRRDHDDSHAYMNRIEALMETKNERPVVFNLPSSQTLLIRRAIAQYLKDMQRILICPTESQAHEMYDLRQLEALMKYDVMVVLTEDETKSFSVENLIDLPQYN
jgi:hypothetical protein